MSRPLFKRALCLCLALSFALAAAVPSFAAYEVPITLSEEGESVYLINMSTGEVLLDEGSDTVRYIASTTKMMTALLLIESGYDLSTIITISSDLTQEFYDIQAENGADMELEIGEEISMEDLLYGLLLRSANDAASVIAYVLGEGDIATFIAAMNTRAEELGCTNTNFTCAHGLYDAGNVSTAQDLALIAAACAAEPLYMQVANTQSYTVHTNNAHSSERVLTSTNYMMDPEYEYYRDYIHGMKTGFTTLAGRCFVTTASQNGDEYLLAVLGASKEGIFLDCSSLLDWAFESFGTRTLLTKGTALGEVFLTDSYDAEVFTVYADATVNGYGHIDDEITIDIDIPTIVKAPIAVGDVLGTATVYLGDREIKTIDIVAQDEYVTALSVDAANTRALLLPLIVGIVVLALLSRLSATAMKSTATMANKRRARRR